MVNPMINLTLPFISLILIFCVADMWTAPEAASHLRAFVENQVDDDGTLETRAKILARATLKVEVIEPIPFRARDVYQLEPSGAIRDEVRRRLGFEALQVIGVRVLVSQSLNMLDGDTSRVFIGLNSWEWPTDEHGRFLKSPIRASLGGGNDIRQVFRFKGVSAYGPFYVYGRLDLSIEETAHLGLPFIICVDFDGPPTDNDFGESIAGYVVWGDVIDLDQRRPGDEKP